MTTPTHEYPEDLGQPLDSLRGELAALDAAVMTSAAAAHGCALDLGALDAISDLLRAKLAAQEALATAQRALRTARAQVRDLQREVKAAWEADGQAADQLRATQSPAAFAAKAQAEQILTAAEKTLDDARTAQRLAQYAAKRAQQTYLQVSDQFHRQRTASASEE